MKNEAVIMSPTAIMETARVGYHASETGLVTGFGACRSMIREITKCEMAKTLKSNGIAAGEIRSAFHRFQFHSPSNPVSLVLPLIDWN